MRETAGKKIKKGSEGNGQRDRRDRVTDRRRVRRPGREMREEEWGLQLRYVRAHVQDEAAKRKKEKKINFHRVDTPKLIPSMGLESQPCI